MTSVGPGTQPGTQQTQTVSGLQVALLIVGNFTIKCHAVLEYGGRGKALPEANVVVGVQMLLLELEVLLQHLLFRYFTREPPEDAYQII